jgi:uncharacterized protein YndB with AHSA1/START domain
MTMAQTNVTTSEREIVITRLFDAPPELVFSAWSDPEGISHWWGPNGFRTTTHEMEFRPGGVWRFTMHGPDGVDYPNRIVYTEIVPPERIAYAHRGEGDLDDIAFEALVTFEPEGDGTRLTMRSRFATPAERNRVIEEFGAVEGGNQTLARLAEHLAARHGR